jgi:hypothetical protein
LHLNISHNWIWNFYRWVKKPEMVDVWQYISYIIISFAFEISKLWYGNKKNQHESCPIAKFMEGANFSHMCTNFWFVGEMIMVIIWSSIILTTSYMYVNSNYVFIHSVSASLDVDTIYYKGRELWIWHYLRVFWFFILWVHLNLSVWNVWIK